MKKIKKYRKCPALHRRLQKLSRKIEIWQILDGRWLEMFRTEMTLTY